MSAVATEDGNRILFALIKVIQANKQYLSDIDGLIGDGDHGVNMNKGFTLCEEALKETPGDLSHGLKTLAQILITQIGGSLGPLYGMFFRGMAKASKDLETLDAAGFAKMLVAAKEKVLTVSDAQRGDKTLLDTLLPAEEAFRSAQDAGESFAECLTKMSEASETGRDSTKDMIAKVGRSSRLGERSRGVLDAGATSCCLLLQAFAEALREKL
ncbi:MAG: dihydroxyacetone kinase subunit L [Planctomycetes bacterium]|nr:dihydroxyacetone kinase subunit L [Planctomycetota bacterium]